jgi:hypothetical protein
MKHITYAQKSLLVGDEAADVLLQYAAFLAANGSADNVEIRGVGVDGEEVVATLVLGNGIDLMAETTRSVLPEPDNSAALAYMRERSSAIEGTTARSPVPTSPSDFGDLDEV